jgi:hypothetical protein
METCSGFPSLPRGGGRRLTTFAEHQVFDYDRQFGVSVQTIMGAKKMTFNSKDFGSIVLSTFATAP